MYRATEVSRVSRGNLKSGYSVSLSADGKTVAIGAWLNDDRTGHVRVYELDGDSVWSQIGADIDGEAANDFSGNSVSLSADGTTVAIGAPSHDDRTGHVRVYKLDGDSAKSPSNS
jgi:hypothetical protein